MPKSVIFWLCCLALFLAGGRSYLLQAQNLVEPLAVQDSSGHLIRGSFDWTDGVLTVYGEGMAPQEVSHPAQRRLMALRAAKAEAYRNLLEVVGQVQVDSRTTVDMARLSSDTVRLRITGLVHGAQIVPGSQEEEGDLFRLALRLHLLGEFAETVLPAALSPADTSPPEPLPDSLPAADSLLLFYPARPYTGLIIDVRGLDLRPSMAPRILTPDQRVLYSAPSADQTLATRMGLVGYATDIERAATSDRLGGKQAYPLIIQAEGVAGLYRADAVIRNDDAVRVRMADAESNFLSACRVVFVLGPAPSPLDSSAAALVDSILLMEEKPDSLYLEEGDELDLPGETE